MHHGLRAQVRYPSSVHARPSREETCDVRGRPRRPGTPRRRARRDSTAATSSPSTRAGPRRRAHRPSSAPARTPPTRLRPGNETLLGSRPTGHRRTVTLSAKRRWVHLGLSRMGEPHLNRQASPIATSAKTPATRVPLSRISAESRLAREGVPRSPHTRTTSPCSSRFRIECLAEGCGSALNSAWRRGATSPEPNL